MKVKISEPNKETDIFNLNNCINDSTTNLFGVKYPRLIGVILFIIGCLYLTYTAYFIFSVYVSNNNIIII